MYRQLSRDHGAAASAAIADGRCVAQPTNDQTGRRYVGSSNTGKLIMAADPKQAHEHDRERIDVKQHYELSYWAETLGTTAEKVKEAVRVVGDRAEKVRGYLRKERHPDEHPSAF
jgi:hypothetical protein